MGFKLGRERRNYMINGKLRSKLRFHTESGDPDLSVPGTPIIRKKLEPGVLGEANMDGSIYISNKLKPGSHEETQTVLHEMKHATDIKLGKTGYTDDYVFYNGIKYTRKTRNGKDMINIDGEWKEAGDETLPWEHDANNGNV